MDGYNKGLRDLCRACLWATAALHMIGWPRPALIASLCAVVLIMKGTQESFKNMKWGFASWASLVCSIFASIMEHFLSVIDQERAYTLYMIVWLLERSTELIVAAMLGMLLFIAADLTPTTQNNGTSAKKG